MMRSVQSLEFLQLICFVKYTYVHVERFIDLLDERYTKSEITNTEYDTDVKKEASPVEQETA